MTSLFTRIRHRPLSHGNVSSIRKSSQCGACFTGSDDGHHSNVKSWIPNRSKTASYGTATATAEELDLVQNDTLHENNDHSRDQNQDMSSRSNSISSCSLISGKSDENGFADERFGLSVPRDTMSVMPHSESDQGEETQRSRDNQIDDDGNNKPREITQGEKSISPDSERKTTPSDQRSSTTIPDSHDAAKSDFNSLHDDSLPNTISVEMHGPNTFVSPSTIVLHDSSSAELQLTGTGFSNARIPDNTIPDDVVSHRAQTSGRNSVSSADSRRSSAALFAYDRGSLSYKGTQLLISFVCILIFSYCYSKTSF